MGWTKWRKLAERGEWFDEHLDHAGPACYELGLGGPRGGGIRIVYVGETSNERKRMSTYGRTGSHLDKIIKSALRDRWSLFYRAQAKATKEAAKVMQDRLLNENEYYWNIILNR